MEFRVVESEDIYRGRVFTLAREAVAYPDGRQAVVEFLRHGGAVTILPVDEDGNIWFVRQFRHPTGGMLLELPAGTLEPGEEPLACAQREIREEIGMAAQEWEKIGEFYLAPGYSSEYMYAYLGRGLRPGALEQDEGEFIRVEKYPLARVYQMMAEGEIRDAKTLAVLVLARARLLG